MDLGNCCGLQVWELLFMLGSCSLKGVHGSGSLPAPSSKNDATDELPNITTETPENRQLKVATLFHVYPPAFLRKVVAEIVVAFLLVFVTSGAGSLRTKDDHKVSRLGASVAGGLIVTVMVYAVGHISGAHMNPVVTLAFAAVGHFLWAQVTSAVATE